jgi:hypothetical protein
MRWHRIYALDRKHLVLRSIVLFVRKRVQKVGQITALLRLDSKKNAKKSVPPPPSTQRKYKNTVIILGSCKLFSLWSHHGRDVVMRRFYFPFCFFSGRLTSQKPFQKSRGGRTRGVIHAMTKFSSCFVGLFSVESH